MSIPLRPRKPLDAFGVLDVLGVLSQEEGYVVVRCRACLSYDVKMLRELREGRQARRLPACESCGRQKVPRG